MWRFLPSHANGRTIINLFMSPSILEPRRGWSNMETGMWRHYKGGAWCPTHVLCFVCLSFAYFECCQLHYTTREHEARVTILNCCDIGDDNRVYYAKLMKFRNKIIGRVLFGVITFFIRLQACLQCFASQWTISGYSLLVSPPRCLLTNTWLHSTEASVLTT